MLTQAIIQQWVTNHTVGYVMMLLGSVVCLLGQIILLIFSANNRTKLNLNLIGTVGSGFWLLGFLPKSHLLPTFTGPCFLILGLILLLVWAMRSVRARKYRKQLSIVEKQVTTDKIWPPPPRAS